MIDEVRRVAEEQLGRARRDLEEPGDDPVAATHDCRKRCSKLRGLARLVRPALGGGYRPANVALRGAARQLDSLRDAHALLETFDAVVAAEPAGSSGCDLSPVRAELQTRSDEANRRAREGSGELDVAHRLLVEAEDAIATWELDESGVDAVADGLRRTYRRGRTALGSAVEDPSDERFHEYRKRTKYTWYHLRLLEPVAPSVLAPLAGAFHDLADALGDDHDLAVLTAQLRDDPDAFGGARPAGAAIGLLDVRREVLHDRSFRLGRRLHGERSKDLARRVRAYWKAHDELGPELPTGEVADLWPPSDDGLDELTVDELCVLAGERNVAGRSGLRRDDLVGALRAGG